MISGDLQSAFITAQTSIALSQFTLDLVAAESEKAIYAKLAESLPAMLPADRASVTLLTEEATEFEIFALHGESGVLPLGKFIPFDNTLAGMAITQSTTLCHNITQSETRVDGKELYQQGLRSIINAPLKLANKHVGTINLASNTPHAYDENSARLLTLVTTLVATYLERQQLLVQAQMGAQQYKLYSQQLEVLHQIAARLSTASSEQDTFEVIADSVHKVISAQRISYLRANDNSSFYQVNTIYCDGTIVMPNVLDITKSPLKDVIQNGEAILFDNIAASTMCEHQRLAKQGVHTAWSVPVKIDGKIAGILNIATRDVVTNGKQQLELLKMFSEIMGVTLTRVNLQIELEHQAGHDSLTALPNRKLLNQKVSSLVSENTADTFTLLFIDLDRFKQVNDSLGHTIGDELLCQAAYRINQQIRENDFIARIGGDEFVVILSNNQSEHSARKTALRIIDALKLPFYINEKQVFIGASIGVSCYPKHSLDPNELLKYADIAMYQAKKSGRNSLQFYSDSLLTLVNNNQVIETKLRLALKANKLELAFQPLINKDQLSGVEALLRWQDPELGQVSPATFIPIAEESLLINDITEWVIKHSLLALQKLRKYAPDLYVSVNISAKDCSNLNKLKTTILSNLNCYQLPGSALKLELTESVFLENMDEIEQVFNELKSLGIQLAIDDFGTGFSSLSYLLNLPLDQIKIDRSFITNIDKDKAKYGVVKGISAIASSLSIDCLAEGIETQEQKLAVEQLGCHQFQGYLFSHPLSVSELTTLLRDQGGKL